MNHSGDANKMVSDTPRTDAEYERLFEIYQNAERINGPLCCAFENDMRLCRQLERELNAANESFRKLNIHTLNLVDRIRRLEEAGDAMDKTAEPFVLDTIDEDTPMSKVCEQYEIIYDSPPTAGDHVAMDRARKDWRKAKEAKP